MPCTIQPITWTTLVAYASLHAAITLTVLGLYQYSDIPGLSELHCGSRGIIPELQSYMSFDRGMPRYGSLLGTVRVTSAYRDTLTDECCGTAVPNIIPGLSEFNTPVYRNTPEGCCLGIILGLSYGYSDRGVLKCSIIPEADS